MTITHQDLLEKINGAFTKLDDADTKLCEVYLDPRVLPEDVLTIRRGVTHIAESKMDISKCLETVEP